MRKISVRALLCCSLSCTVLLTAASSLAAPPPRAADEDATVAIARERFKEGVAFFDQKQYDKARVAFLQAYALKKHPAVLLNLAQSELRCGREVDAAKHFSTYLRESTTASDAERQSAEAGLNATKSTVALLDVNVDESGTEAAAATAVVIGKTSAPIDPFQLTIDRPFIYLIRDVATDTIVFMGRVTDPTAEQ